MPYYLVEKTINGVKQGKVLKSFTQVEKLVQEILTDERNIKLAVYQIGTNGDVNEIETFYSKGFKDESKKEKKYLIGAIFGLVGALILTISIICLVLAL